jgi:hypothetical protein
MTGLEECPPLGRWGRGGFGGLSRRGMGGVRLTTFTGTSIRSRLSDERACRSPPCVVVAP